MDVVVVVVVDSESVDPILEQRKHLLGLNFLHHLSQNQIDCKFGICVSVSGFGTVTGILDLGLLLLLMLILLLLILLLLTDGRLIVEMIIFGEEVDVILVLIEEAHPIVVLLGRVQLLLHLNLNLLLVFLRAASLASFMLLT